jgi:hypothetical protein
MDKYKYVFPRDPDAIDVRGEGKCECCQQESLFSYTLAQFKNTHPNPEKQYCGYYCANCGFGAAGERDRLTAVITIKQIQDDLYAKHGNDWPKYALYRFSELKELLAHGARDNATFAEYQTLSEWLINAVEASCTD